MKKLYFALLCLTLLALVGCGAANVPAPTPSITPDSSEPQKTPEPIVSGTDEPATFATKDAEMLIYSPTEGGMIDAVHLTWHHRSHMVWQLQSQRRQAELQPVLLRGGWPSGGCPLPEI